MGAITAALRKGAEAHGAVVRTGAPVEEILLKGGRAAGVRLVGGEVVPAETVLSNADPRPTLRLLPKAGLTADQHARNDRRDLAARWPGCMF